MERKTFPSIAIKVDADQGLVDHIVAVMGNVDLGSDVIHPGAFTKTIAERAGKIRVLDQHNYDSIMRVIGKPVSLREIGRDELPAELLTRFPDATGGLLATTQYLLGTPEGKGAFERIKAGAVDEYSIGYDALDLDYSKVTRDGKEVTVRNLRTIKLYEYSPVLWGMNPATTTLSAKSRSEVVEEKLRRRVAVKAVNLSQRVQDVCRAFYTQYPDVYAENEYQESVYYYVREVWDEFLVVKQETRDAGRLWKVTYTVADSGVTFADPSAWVELAQIYVPLAATQGSGQMAATASGLTAGPAPEAGKAGRVLSARNAERITSAIATLQEALMDAGLMDPPEENEAEDQEEAAPKRAADNPEAKAGPGGTLPPTTETLLRIIELEQSELSLLEV